MRANNRRYRRYGIAVGIDGWKTKSQYSKAARAPYVAGKAAHAQLQLKGGARAAREAGMGKGSGKGGKGGDTIVKANKHTNTGAYIVCETVECDHYEYLSNMAGYHI